MYEEAREGHAADLAYVHDLTLPQGRKLSDLAVHFLEPEHVPDAPGYLADGAIAEAFVSAPLGVHATDDSVARLDRFARRTIERGFDTAGAWFARACVAEHCGELDAQRAHLERSIARDETFAPSLAAMGFLAFVEGDERRARRLLGRSGRARHDALLHLLDHHPTPAPVAGRNDPCPCGSTRKYKHCCSGTFVLPLPERAIWLWEKLDEWLHRLPQHVPLMAFFEQVIELPEEERAGRLDAGLQEAIRAVPVRAIALLEGRLLERFLARYGEVLPADELTLAERWMVQRHRVWRVEATTPGSTLVLTDLATEDTVEATNGSVSRCTEPGEVVYGVVVPTGSGWLLPCHPTGLLPEDGEVLAELLGAGVDPLAVAATLVRGIQNATM